MFPAQGLNVHLLHLLLWQVGCILYHWATWEIEVQDQEYEWILPRLYSHCRFQNIFFFFLNYPYTSCAGLSRSVISTLGNPMDCSPPGSSVHGDSPGKNKGVGCHALFQGIFPTQGSNPCLLHCRQIVYCLSHQESPRILEWVAYPFSRGTPLYKQG